MPNLSTQNKLPVFPNWFPYNDMLFDGHMKVGQWEGVKTRSWDWKYRGPVLLYNSLRTSLPALDAYKYKDSPLNHKVIIGVGELAEVRELKISEATKMLANFNNKPLAQIKRIVQYYCADYTPEKVIYSFYDFGPYIAPFKVGFFFKNLTRFKEPVPFNWPSGPIKPIFIPVSVVEKAFEKVGINPKTLVS